MDEKIKEKIDNLLENQRFAVIATQDKNSPYTNLVTFLASNDYKKIFFPTNKNTKKFENISSNSKISVLIDNRGNKAEDIKNAMALTAVGITTEIKDGNIIKSFIKKHPYLLDFINSKDCVMMEIDIERYVLVDNFQNVSIINFK